MPEITLNSAQRDLLSKNIINGGSYLIAAIYESNVAAFHRGLTLGQLKKIAAFLDKEIDKLERNIATTGEKNAVIEF